MLIQVKKIYNVTKLWNLKNANKQKLRKNKENQVVELLCTLSENYN